MAGFIEMKIIQNRKEWRYEATLKLIEAGRLNVIDAISETKELEKYVFQDDFIVEIKNKDQRDALENLIKSMDQSD
ncbi:hypothetical protein F960_01254 [Acinetobacter gerneri DSM 14967 = CIP 107464 = MTCC 9824]|uniref:Uncharacterized protein n=2 Tax=Acinetobacter gerneri TaxID=202952 RepID=N8YD33_9GAMM|nr:hypothetical protein F960_01254 [Acinetobacter gerneri DSM 14967 = CIP 107464 = MTCC 9824]